MARIKGTSNTDDVLGGAHSGLGIADNTSVVDNAARLSDAEISFAGVDITDAARSLIDALPDVGNTVMAANLLKTDPTALTNPKVVEELGAAKHGKATVGADGIFKKTNTPLTPSTAFLNTHLMGR